MLRFGMLGFVNTLPLRLGILLLCLEIANSSEAQSVVSSFSLSKTASYVQHNEKEVTLKEYEFSATVEGTKGIADISTPILGTPNESSLKLEFTGSEVWSLRSSFDTPESLEKAFPGGSYTLKLMDYDGLTLQMPTLETAFPKEAPQFTGGTWEGGALVVPQGEDYVFLFNEYSSFAQGDKITFSLSGGETLITRTFSFDSEMEIPTRVTIPRESLRLGEEYTASLQFISETDVDTKSIDGAIGSANGKNQTTIKVLAVPEPLISTLLMLATLMSPVLSRRRSWDHS